MQKIVMVDQDSRANVLPIYGDLYRNVLYLIFNLKEVAYLGFAPGLNDDVIRMASITRMPLICIVHCSLWRSQLLCNLHVFWSNKMHLGERWHLFSSLTLLDNKCLPFCIIKHGYGTPTRVELEINKVVVLSNYILNDANIFLLL